MKKFYLVSLMVIIPTSAFAMSDLTCMHSERVGTYRVFFKNGAASVSVGYGTLLYGNLTCYEMNSGVGLIATCRTPEAVADEGFKVELYRDTSGVFTAKLWERYYGDPIFVGAYPCSGTFAYPETNN